MAEKVSIIVPVYNVEKYLHSCINSLLAQDYGDLEIILINDGSNDSCPIICDEYAKRDSRIQVIHKINGGAASARNLGLDTAKGTYICFVDGDDVVNHNYVSSLLHELENADADIAVCSYYYLFKNKEIKTGYSGMRQVLTQKEFLLRFLDDWTCGLIWNKIFLKEIIGNIRFEEGHKIDDEFFTYQLVMNSRKVVIFDNPLYKYRMRASGVMSSSEEYIKKIISDRLDYSVKRFEDVIGKYPELKEPYLRNLMDNLISLLHKCQSYDDLKVKVEGQLRKYKWPFLFSSSSVKEKYSLLYSLYGGGRYLKDTEPVRSNMEDYFE